MIKLTLTYNVDLALDRQSYLEMLQENEELLDHIRLDLENGREPDEIRRHIIGVYGENRSALALRAEQVARYLLRQRTVTGDMPERMGVR